MTWSGVSGPVAASDAASVLSQKARTSSPPSQWHTIRRHGVSASPVCSATQPAQDWRGQRRELRRWRGRAEPRGEERAPGGRPREVPLAGVHQLDVPFVALTGVVAEGEEAVLEEDDAYDARVFLVGLRHGLRQGEAGHDVGQDRDAVAEGVAYPRLAVGLVRHGEHGVGVAVVDEAVGQEGVEERFDRRGRRSGVEQMRS